MYDVVVFHPGTQHSWQTAQALQQMGRLDHYATSIFYQPDRWPYRIERYVPQAVAQRMQVEFRRFSHPALDPSRVRTTGMTEWFERLATRAGYRRLARRLDRIGNRRFGRAMQSVIRSDAPFLLWGYDSSSLEAFRTAKAAGRLCILDRTIGDWRAYNAEMAAIHDAYADFFPEGEWRVPQWRFDQDDAEYELADMILTGCPFAAATVRDCARDPRVAGRVRVLDYCYDEQLFGDMMPLRPHASGQPLRFVALGQANVRKGIHLLLKVFDRVPRNAAVLTIVGDVQVPPATFARYADRVTVRKTVARADVPALLAQNDVLVFPSYFEGAGIVLYEALAAGVGLIQSRNCALAVTNETGLLLAELSEEALYGAVMTAIEDRARVDGWREAAPASARRFSFAQYKQGVACVLDEACLVAR